MPFATRSVQSEKSSPTEHSLCQCFQLGHDHLFRPAVCSHSVLLCTFRRCQLWQGRADLGLFQSTLSGCVPLFGPHSAGTAYLNEHSPLLRAAICTIASRYFALPGVKSALSSDLLQYSLDVAATQYRATLVNTCSDPIGTIQGLLLLAAFPATTNENQVVTDRATWSWLLFGQVSTV